MNCLFNINVCRVCMQSGQSCDLGSDKDLLEKFEFTTRLAITEEDNLPKALCSKCTARLKIAYTFIKTSHESENNLKIFIAKISTEFKEVTEGSKSINKSLNEQNLTEDDILSLMDEGNHEDILPDTIVHEKRKKCLRPDINTEKYKTEVEVEKSKNFKEIIKSTKENLHNSKKDEAVYHLSKDVLLIHGNDNEIDNEYDSSTHFMEIPSNDDEQKTEKEHYNEDVREDQEEEKTYGSINVLEVNDESEIHSQSSDLVMEEAEGIPDYEKIVNIQDDAIQYHSIYVDESSIEEDNRKNSDDNDYYVNNLNEEENEMQENSTNKEIANDQRELMKKSCSKTEIIIHRFYCDKCNRDFSTKTNLNRHMQSHEGNKPFSCTECKKSFTQKSTLKQHMYTHTGERPYVCEVCNRLIFHMRRHTGEKPFHCEYCLITFRQKDALRIHIIKHHVVIEQTMDGSELFTCIICQKKFDTKVEFKIHMKVHTAPAEIDNVVELRRHVQEWPALKKTNISSDSGESGLLMPIDSECINAAVVNVSASSAAEPSRAKKFQCRKCFKCFALKKSLVRHMRIHYVNNDDLTECFDCELQFSSTDVYREHLSEYHQYACSACPEQVFKTMQDLKIHMFEHELDQQENSQ